jgi:crotonobetainyl-CoA:carnitine CoA-transferase CaiB-like acyl-CoA transferase
MSGPLHGYKIIELTSTVSGPLAGMILGDQGADIVKIEPPMIGDLARHMGDIRNGMSAMYATLNRNKRSLVLDLKDAADMEIFLRLVPTADVLIENYRPGVAEKLGIDYESLKQLNPTLVYASITGYGESGPYQHRRVYDPLIQATTGTASAQNSDRPANIRTIIFDKVTGYTTAQAITAALLSRAKTGKGQRLSISMLSSALYFQWPDVMWSHTFEGGDTQEGGALADWFQIFKTADGFAAVILVTSEAFEKFCLLLGLQLHLDERFSSLPARLANMETLQQLSEDALTGWSTDVLCAELDAHDVPVARINSLDEMLTDPQIAQQEALCHVEHPVAGSMCVANTPFQFEGQDTLPVLHAAELGQHSAEILKELGCSQESIDRIEQREEKNREIMANFSLAQAK